MISTFRERSPAASSRDETGSFTSSREQSRSFAESDMASSVSSREGNRTLEGIKLELELRNERIKEVENAYEELRRKSEFTAGQLQCDLQLATDQHTKALQTIEELTKAKDKMEAAKWHAINQAAELAVQMQGGLKLARAEGEEKIKALIRHNSLESSNPNTVNSNNNLLDAKQKYAAIEKNMKEEKQKAAESIKALEAEKQNAVESIKTLEAEKQKADESIKALEAEKQKAVESNKALEAEKQNAVEAEKQKATESIKALEAEKQKAVESIKALEAEKHDAMEFIKTLESGRNASRDVKRNKGNLAVAEAATGEKTYLLGSGESRASRFWWCNKCSVM